MKDREKYFELDKTKDFDDFKKKYLKAVDKLEKVNYSGKVTAKRIESVEKAVAQMPVSHRLLAESKISGIEFTDSKVGNSYSKKTRIKKRQYMLLMKILFTNMHMLWKKRLTYTTIRNF